jgi:hypothetical protein
MTDEESESEEDDFAWMFDSVGTLRNSLTASTVARPVALALYDSRTHDVVIKWTKPARRRFLSKLIGQDQSVKDTAQDTLSGRV